MIALEPHVFRRTVNSQVEDLRRRGIAPTYQRVRFSILRSGYQPRDQQDWQWARAQCEEGAA